MAAVDDVTREHGTYRVIEHHIGDHTDDLIIATRLDYDTALARLLAVARLNPRLHQPGARAYLAVEPDTMPAGWRTERSNPC